MGGGSGGGGGVEKEGGERNQTEEGEGVGCLIKMRGPDTLFPCMTRCIVSVAAQLIICSIFPPFLFFSV